MRIFYKITKHARLRVFEYVGYMEDDEIIAWSEQPNCEYRFIWNSKLTSKHCIKTLITVIPPREVDQSGVNQA